MGRLSSAKTAVMWEGASYPNEDVHETCTPRRELEISDGVTNIFRHFRAAMKEKYEEEKFTSLSLSCVVVRNFMAEDDAFGIGE